MNYSHSDSAITASNVGSINIEHWHFSGEHGYVDVQTKVRIEKTISDSPLNRISVFYGTMEELINKLYYRQPVVNAPYLPKEISNG